MTTIFQILTNILVNYIIDFNFVTQIRNSQVIRYIIIYKIYSTEANMKEIAKLTQLAEQTHTHTHNTCLKSKPSDCQILSIICSIWRLNMSWRRSANRNTKKRHLTSQNVLIPYKTSETVVAAKVIFTHTLEYCQCGVIQC